MTAETGIFLEAVARRDVAHAMPEHTAQVAHFLLEGRRGRVRIVLGIEQQRVSALGADIFVTAVAIGELLVVVLVEEARQRVSDTGDRAVFSQVAGPASAPPIAAGILLEDVVVDVMAPQSA
jgi:hypothetical protein